MPKICQICAVDFTLQKFLLPLIHSQQNRGWDVTAVCSPGNYISELRSKGYKIKTILFSRNFNILSHLISCFLLIMYFQKEKFDIVHAHTPIVGMIARFVSYLSKVSFTVYTAHGFYFHENMIIFAFSFYDS